MPNRRRHLALSAVSSLVLALPCAARADSLTISDTSISIAECLDRNNQDVTLSSWSFSSSSGSTIDVYGSDTSGCETGSSSVTTATLVSDLSSDRTSYPGSGETSFTVADVLAAAGKTVTDCEGSDFTVYVCLKLRNSSGSVVSTASAGIELQLERPPAPVSVSTAVGDQALWVSWSAGDATSSAPASSASYRAFASAGGQTFESGETSENKIRLGGLQNDTTYDVWAVAYSAAGNESAKSDLTAGTPRKVYDFYDLYTSSGGSTSSGCDQGGGAGALSLVALGLRAARRRRRTESRPKAALVPALLATVAAGLLSCASSGAPPAPPLADRPPLAGPLPSSSVAAVLARRADLALSEREVAALEEIAGQLARSRLELQAAAEAAPAGHAGGQGDAHRGGGGGARPAGPDGAPAGGGGAGAGPGGMPGMGGPPGAGAPARPKDDPETRLTARLDAADTDAYWRAEEALDPAHREPARAVAASYREALFELREANRRAPAR